MAAGAADDGVPTVSYRSGGRLLIVGDAGAALDWADRLSGTSSVSVLITGRAWADLPARRGYPVVTGDDVEISGWLGAFEARWKQRDPIDLDACVRCGACVSACGSVGAIEFDRSEPARSAKHDLVLDLRASPAFRIHQPPQGYFHPGTDVAEQMQAALKLTAMTGEFEKPKFFRYDARICAHGRNGKQGCTACIDICSTRAISSEGDTVRVEPHL